MNKHIVPGLIFFVTFISVSFNVFALDIKSSVFENKGYIPERYTCSAQNISPSLSWEAAPSNTKSFVLICDDPDAPYKTWVHWVVFNIPGDMNTVNEGITREQMGSLGIVQGANDFGQAKYGGPCPPQGKPHRYFFRLYALDKVLSLKEGAAMKDIIKAMQGHIIAETKMFGFYQRQAEE